MEVLRFAQLQSCVDVSFWSEYGDRKLNEYKLSEEPVDISGWFGASRYPELPGQVQLDAASFPTPASSTKTVHAGLEAGDVAALPLTQSTTRPGMHTVPATLIHTNMLDTFHAISKPAVLQQAAMRIWSDITSGAAEAAPQLLCRFLLLAHADLKHHHVHYWCAFPALKPPTAFTAVSGPEGCHSLLSAVGADVAAKVVAACNVWRFPDPQLHEQPAQGQQDKGTEAASSHPAAPAPFWLLVSRSGDWATDAEPQPLSAWHSLQGSGAAVMLAAADPCNTPGHPGWPLRNALLLAAVRWGVSELRVVCVRDVRGRTDASRCLLLHTMLVPPLASAPAVVPEAVGWEAHPTTGKLAARVLDLAPILSPAALADQAVDLNLRLMRWRAAPTLDTGTVTATKCLLMGAGTLGCAVARTLLAWGVRHITFVDSSRVSYSNPVRQSLFDFEDCLGGGKPKAEAAANALRRILPSVVAVGHALSIPMPGHAPANSVESESMRKDTDALDALVRAHDAVFLLTDTRESRWLPALLAAAHGKLALTSAVGFDSFLVMRHGAGPLAEDAVAAAEPIAIGSGHGHTHPAHQSQRLGCYFCNDIVAPANSTIDRTLDQQCTVARPGLAPIAGAIAAEMLAALMQHPHPLYSPTPTSTFTQPTSLSHAASSSGSSSAQGALGPVPHMVRGHLSGFSQTVMEGRAFSGCTACSPAVVAAYRAHGWDLVLAALKDPRHLEGLTGLSALHEAAAGMMRDEEEAEAGSGAGAGAAGGGDATGVGACLGTSAGTEAATGAGAGAGGTASDEGDEWLAL